MSSELIPLAEAAQRLGVSVDKLTEMRSNNEIFGYRDGSSWKFKLSELERVADELGVTLGAAGAPEAVLEESDDEFSLSDSDGSSGLISDLDTPVESDKDEVVGLDGDDGLSLADSGEISLVDSGELNLADSGELSFAESDISLATKIGSEDGKVKDPSASDDLMLVDEDLFDDDSALSLQDSAGISDGSELGSDFADSSDIIVADSDSDAPGSSSDVVLDEDDLVVAGGDDDFALSDDDILSLDGDANSQDATEALGGVDDFDLAPTGDSFDDQSSSSQIIALDESEIIDDSSGIGGLDGASGDLFDGSDEMGGAAPIDPFDEAGGFDEGQNDGMVMMVPESSYSIWQLTSLSLALCLVGLLFLCTISLIQNMWLPDNTASTTTFANWLAELMDFDS